MIVSVFGPNGGVAQTTADLTFANRSHRPHLRFATTPPLLRFRNGFIFSKTAFIATPAILLNPTPPTQLPQFRCAREFSNFDGADMQTFILSRNNLQKRVLRCGKQ